jgi:2-amino-4-hydroxy-6-hydroxymethyldihydropteridine diphosphokinase
MLKKIECKIGRKKTFKNGPREIDLDIIFYENKIINTAHLSIPHPRAHLRRFVLKPLAEISPGFVHPVFKKTVKKLLQDCMSV